MTKLTTKDIKAHIANTVTQEDVAKVIRRINAETYGFGLPLDVEENMLTTMRTPAKLVRGAKDIMYDKRIAREFTIKPYATDLGMIRAITDVTDTQVLEVRYGSLYTPDEFVFALVESDAHDVPHFIVTSRALWEKKGHLDDRSPADQLMTELGLERLSECMYELNSCDTCSLPAMCRRLIDLGYVQSDSLKDAMTDHGTVDDHMRPKWMHEQSAVDSDEDDFECDGDIQPGDHVKYTTEGYEVTGIVLIVKPNGKHGMWCEVWSKTQSIGPRMGDEIGGISSRPVTSVKRVPGPRGH